MISLAESHPELAKQWHPTLNEKTPNEVSRGSHLMVWWSDHGHIWKCTVKDRTRSDGREVRCGVCTNYQIQPGVNDISTTHPELASELHPTLNLPAVPQEIHGGTGKKIWWLCNKNHVWKVRPVDRTKKGYGCPYCSGRKAWPGETDVATTNPELASMWSPKNTTKMTEVSRGSNTKVDWLCGFGHTWRASVKSVAVLNSGCPHCVERHNPLIEKILANAFEKRNLTAVLHHKTKKPFFSGRPIIVDIWVPEINLVVEHDGRFFHRDRVLIDTEKTKILLADYKVWRLRETGLDFLTLEDVWLYQTKFTYTTDVDTIDRLVDSIVEKTRNHD